MYTGTRVQVADTPIDGCDRILRVVFEGKIQFELLIDLLRKAGCVVEVLADTIDTY